MIKEHDSFTDNIVAQLAETLYKLHNGELVAAEKASEYIEAMYLNVDEALCERVYSLYTAKVDAAASSLQKRVQDNASSALAAYKRNEGINRADR